MAKPEYVAHMERLREGLGLSQAALAKRLDVSPMAVSRWERGINEPPADIYVQLGKMAAQIEQKWFFWQRAGLSKEDVQQGLAAKSAAPRALAARAGAAPAPGVPIFAGSVGKDGSRFDRAHVVGHVQAPAKWCPAGSKCFSVEMRGDSMSPVIEEGYFVTIDENQTDRTKLTGQMVLAKIGGKLLIRWIRRYGRTEMLVPENRKYDAIPFNGEPIQIVGKVIWWTGRSRQS